MMFFDDDITSDILARLPPKQLARARCVCKRWRSLTSDYHFLRMHFACNANNSISGFFLRGRVNHTEYFPLQGFKVHIYSSETRSWRQADIDSSSRDQFKGLQAYRSVFWNGLLIWIVRDHLLSFDIEREQVKKLPMPDHRPENWNCHYIGESGGFLQMTGYTKEQKLTACFDVLEMDCDCSGWSVLYRIDLSRIKELYPEIQMKVRIPRPGTRRSVNIVDHLALSHVYVVRGRGGAEKGGMLLFGIPGKIMCYDVAKKEFRIVCEVSIPSPSSCFSEYSWYMFYPYNHSLFTL
uniref:F-box domain-containing protein n=1 Tax=Ananas comosus var. bracteatus TaxID=296719 RepID=A0A6V7QKE7_ANACO|nr:unnamed protein product [Ananas comosus var. bracteatus]